MVVLNIAGLTATYISDPEVVQDMYTGKTSKIVDKTDVLEDMFSPIF